MVPIRTDSTSSMYERGKQARSSMGRKMEYKNGNHVCNAIYNLYAVKHMIFYALGIQCWCGLWCCGNVSTSTEISEIRKPNRAEGQRHYLQ